MLLDLDRSENAQADCFVGPAADVLNPTTLGACALRLGEPLSGSRRGDRKVGGSARARRCRQPRASDKIVECKERRPLRLPIYRIGTALSPRADSGRSARQDPTASLGLGSIGSANVGYNPARSQDYPINYPHGSASMNLEKVVFGFFIVLAATLNFGFFIGDIDQPLHHDVHMLFATIVVNLIATILKLGDRTQLGAIHLSTSLVADLQLGAAALAWGLAVHVHQTGFTPETTTLVVSLSGGALVANIVSVVLLISETIMLRR